MPRDGDGLGMAPRPGEPESTLIPGMAAPAPPRARISPVARFGQFGHVQLGSMPDTSGPGPVALETPLLWNYDFDPATGNARAQFPGIVLINGAPVVTGGVSSFNARTGAVALSQADVSAVAVGSFNTRTGAVVLTAADVNAVAPPPGANSVQVFLGTQTGLAVNPAAATNLLNLGPVGAAGQLWKVSAVLLAASNAGANFLSAAIFNGTAYLCADEAVNPAANQTVTVYTQALTTLTGPTTFSLRGSTSGAGASALITIANASSFSGLGNLSTMLMAERLS